MDKIYRNEEVLRLVQGTYIIHDASVTNSISIGRYKFFKSDKGFYIYIRLDPADEFDETLDNDQDIILSKEVEGIFVQ